MRNSKTPGSKDKGTKNLADAWNMEEKSYPGCDAMKDWLLVQGSYIHAGFTLPPPDTDPRQAYRESSST
jgi:hypothetical protein